MEQMRLQKYMSQAWICSRRKAEEYIERGLVKVNDEVATIWMKVEAWIDRVELEWQAVEEQKNQVYYKINKPRGIITTCAEHGDQNIIDIVDIKERVFPIGRLDKESDGLILLTNDGRITNYLIHPRYEHEKEYLVETFWPIEDEALKKMSRGMLVLGSYTKKARITRVASWKFTIILTEGKNRQIRRMVEWVGGQVKKLKRIRIENIELWNLEPWEYKHLSKKEKDTLFEKLGIS
jgi:23S rRNA pseudouridine2605 synthase/23S rRNA pseudouridine2604 synthase